MDLMVQVSLDSLGVLYLPLVQVDLATLVDHCLLEDLVVQ